MKTLIVLLALVLALAAPARADISRAVELLNQSKFDEAFNDLLPTAEGGDAGAQVLLGTMYLQGKGVPLDYGEAKRWFELAAKSGNAPAQFAMGDLYARGRGVAENITMAMNWFLKAAHQGHVHAQNNLGFAYIQGTGVPQDSKEAAKWFQRAARQGDANAQFNLGLMHQTGEGLPKDPVRAHMWYSLAAKSGDAEAGLARDEMARQLKPDQIKTSGALQAEFKVVREGAPPQVSQTAKPPPAAKSASAGGALPAASFNNKAPVAKFWRVQIAQGTAQAEVALESSKLRFANGDLLKELEVSVSKDAKRKPALHRALLGPLPDREAALQLCEKLLARDVPCEIVAP